MSAQTTYNQSPAIGFQGMMSEGFYGVKQIDSGLVEAAAIGLGVALINGTADNQYKEAVADAAAVGVSIYVSGSEQAADGTIEYGVKEQLPVMRKGRFYAVANAAIAKGADVAFDPATKKWGAVVGGTTTLAVGKAIKTAGADGDIFAVEIDL